MNDTILDYFIQLFSNNLETNYYDLVNRNQLIQKSSTINFRINYCNERTLGYFSEQFINKAILNDKEFLFNEYYINFEITNKDLSNIVNLNEDKYRRSSIFIPDTYFYRKNVLYYIEYKVIESSFRYIALANDFLKFIHYSEYFVLDQAFVFVNFNKVKIGNIYFPILRNPENKVKWCFLKTPLVRSDYPKDTNVFIFYLSETRREISNNIVDKLKIITSLDTINKHAEQFKDLDGDQKFIKTLENDPIIAAKDSYGNNVITSKCLRDHYSSIKKLYNYFNENNINVSLSDNNTYNTIKFKIENINFRNAGIHFKNYMKNWQQNDKDKISVSRFNITNKTSQWILVMLVAFSEYYKLEYFNIHFDEDHKKEETDFEQHKNYVLKLFNERHEKIVNGLCFEISAFIHVLYPKIFDIEGDKIINYKENFNVFLHKQAILKEFKILKKYLFNNDINYEINNIEEFNKEIFIKILEKVLI